MKERVLAVVGAMFLIAAALLLRAQFADDDGGSGSDGRRGSDDIPVVACDDDLQAVCDALVAEGVIAAAPAPLDLDQAAAPDPAIDGWITWDPGPRVADFSDQSSTVWGSELAVASGEMGVLARPAAIEAPCGDTVTWACVQKAPQAGLSVGVGSPATAEGLARMEPFVAAFADGDIEATSDAVEELIDSPQVQQSTAEDMATQLVTTPGAVDLVIGPASVLQAVADTPAGTNAGVRVYRPTPDARQVLVLASRGEESVLVADDICEHAAEALAAAGAPDCGGTLMDDKLAGLLFQVHEKLG